MRNLGSSARRLYTAGLMDGSLHLPLHWEQAFGTPDDNKLRRRKHPAPSESDHAQDQQASGRSRTGDSARFRASNKGCRRAWKLSCRAPCGAAATRRRGTKAGHGAGDTGRSTEARGERAACCGNPIFQIRNGQIADTSTLGEAG